MKRLALVACALLMAFSALMLADTHREFDAASGAITPVSAQSALRVLRAAEHQGAALFCEAYGQTVTGEDFIGATAKLTALKFVGRADQIAFFPMLAGALPGDVGCAIDRQSAYALFHTTDVVGRSVSLGGARHAVTGVIDTDRRLMLVGARPDDMPSYLVTTGADRAALLGALDAEDDPWALFDAEKIRIAALLCALPLICAALMLAARIRRPCLRRAARGATLLATLILALAALPARFLPGRFSDFEFFAKLLSDWSARTPTLAPLRDQMLSGALMRAYLPALLALILMFALYAHRKEVDP